MKAKNKSIGRNMVINDIMMGVTVLLIFCAVFMLFENYFGQTSTRPTTVVVIIDSIDTPVGYKPVGILEFEGLSFGYKYNPFRSQFELYQEVSR